MTLLAFQLVGIGYCAFLLAIRDRTSLTAAENQSINHLAIGALAALPFVLTDFRTLFPTSRSGWAGLAHCSSSARS